MWPDALAQKSRACLCKPLSGCAAMFRPRVAVRSRALLRSQDAAAPGPSCAPATPEIPSSRDRCSPKIIEGVRSAGLEWAPNASSSALYASAFLADDERPDASISAREAPSAMALACADIRAVANS